MPITLGPSTTGLEVVGDYSSDPINELDSVIQNPDVPPAQAGGAGTTGTHLDEISPQAVAQLRVELDAFLYNYPAPAPDTEAMVEDGQTLVITVTGSYTDSVTFTVVGGEITAIVLS